MTTGRGYGKKRVVSFIGATACLVIAGAGCPTDDWLGGTELDRLDCTMAIVEQADQVNVTAAITRNLGVPVELTDGQAVEVNGQPLTGPNADLKYTASVARSNTYVIRTVEPTRGVLDTTVHAPPVITITSPSNGQEVSLSGFTVTWSNPDPDLSSRVRLRQTLLGQTREFVSDVRADEGEITLTAANLANFQQGADIEVTVQRIRQASAIQGFNTGQVSVARSAIVQCVPAP